MSDSLPTGGGNAGSAWLFQGTNDFNALSFLVHQIIAGKAFASIVQVKSVTGGTATGKPPFVSVQPLVAQIDGLGNQTPHGTIYNLPCFRLQGGNGAIVLDPVVGDIGQAIICDRDISNVKVTGAASGPGSWRQNDWADGCYFGGFLNSAPTQYVAINSGGIALVTPNPITITASNITLDKNGNLWTKAGVTAYSGTGSSVTLSGHTHNQPNDSHGDTEATTDPPNAGT